MAMALKITPPSKKLEKNILKINDRLMHENMTLKQDIADQLKLIETMRSRKSKAHRRLKALRELNQHVELLHQVNGRLMAELEALRWRDKALHMDTAFNRRPIPFHKQILAKLGF